MIRSYPRRDQNLCEVYWGPDKPLFKGSSGNFQVPPEVSISRQLDANSRWWGEDVQDAVLVSSDLRSHGVLGDYKKCWDPLTTSSLRLYALFWQQMLYISAHVVHFSTCKRSCWNSLQDTGMVFLSLTFPGQMSWDSRGISISQLIWLHGKL